LFLRTQERLARMEHEGLALRLRNGGYGWGCVDQRDLLNCIAAVERGEAKSEAATVKAFIRRRARVMRLESLLPVSWAKKLPTPVEQ